jgi:hypothetical protein
MRGHSVWGGRDLQAFHRSMFQSKVFQGSKTNKTQKQQGHLCSANEFNTKELNQCQLPGLAPAQSLSAFAVDTDHRDLGTAKP